MTTKHLFLIVALLTCALTTITAQTSDEKNTDPIIPHFDTNAARPTLYVNDGIFHSTEVMFEDSIAFDENLRAFIMQDGVVRGASIPKLVYSGFEDLTYYSTTLVCNFDFLRLPTGNYSLVIPAGSIWWKNNLSIKNDIISRPICVPDGLVALKSIPAANDTIQTLKQFTVTFHCLVKEKTSPSVTLYEGDKIVARFPMQVSYGYGTSAHADFGKTLHFKKGTQYSFVIGADAFQSDLKNTNLTNKEIRITFIGGE